SCSEIGRGDDEMSGIKSIVAGVRQNAAIFLAVLGLAALASFGAIAAQQAGTKPAFSSEEEVAPAKVQELLTLLADPKIQEWLVQQRQIRTVSGSAPQTEGSSLAQYFSARLGAMRAHILALVEALPDLPNQFKRGSEPVSADLRTGGRPQALLVLILFVFLGAGSEWLFRQATRRIRGHLEAHPMETVNDRLRVVGTRFLFGVGLVAAFALGSIGAFVAFEWPPLFRQMLLGYLVATLAIRMAMVVGRFLFAPKAERFRIVPADEVAARFWSRRLTAFIGWFAVGWVFVGMADSLGYQPEARQLVAYALGLGLVAIALEAVWRRPISPASAAPASLPAHHHGRRIGNIILTIGIVLLWALWVLSAMPSFWFLLVAITLPLA